MATYFSKIAVEEEDMAPPQGMATVRTSMAIAGGSGESLGLSTRERDESMSLSPSMEAKTDNHRLWTVSSLSRGELSGVKNR